MTKIYQENMKVKESVVVLTEKTYISMNHYNVSFMGWKYWDRDSAYFRGQKIFLYQTSRYGLYISKCIAMKCVRQNIRNIRINTCFSEINW